MWRVTLTEIHFRPFPSITTLINGRNDDLVEAILKITKQHLLHLHQKKLSGVIQHLWTVNGSDIFDGRFASWSASQVNRNIKSRIDTIFNKYGCFRPDLVPYPSHLQVLAKRIFDEHQGDQAERSQRAAVERRQAETRHKENDLYEGALGLLSRRRGTEPPTLGSTTVRFEEQASLAAELLAANPSSQNNLINPVTPIPGATKAPVSPAVGAPSGPALP